MNVNEAIFITLKVGIIVSLVLGYWEAEREKRRFFTVAFLGMFYSMVYAAVFAAIIFAAFFIIYAH